MVHGPEQKGVQAENVAGDHKGQNLPFAVGQQPIAECHPAREHKSRAGHVTLDRDVDIRLEAFLFDAQRIKHADVFVRERHEMRELRYEWASSSHATTPSAKKMLRVRDFMHEGYLRNYL
jgi:hypothetical protein